jgi:hypothetical protein
MVNFSDCFFVLSAYVIRTSCDGRPFVRQFANNIYTLLLSVGFAFVLFPVYFAIALGINTLNKSQVQEYQTFKIDLYSIHKKGTRDPMPNYVQITIHNALKDDKYGFNEL